MLDIALPGCTSSTSAGRTRRDFLRAGSLGLLSLPGLVKAEAASQARARSVILVFLGGGLSHLDTFDPKPESPTEIRGKYSPIATTVPGLTIGEKLPLLARLMDRVTLVRSASHTSNHHETASNWVLSGRYGTAFGDYPAVGAVVAHEAGDSGGMPPHVAIPRNPSFTWELGKSAFLGGRYESFKAGDPNQAHRRAGGLDPARNASPQSASGFALSSEARLAFAIDREPRSLRDRYGRTTEGQSMLLARRLVEGGARFVTVNCPGWDHHAGIFEFLDRKLPEFDRALSALIEDLDARGRFQETLLVVMSEFGRTPKLNGDAGRDHWGQASSLLFAGAGVKRGFVIGETDRQGAFPTERPVSPADAACTMLDALGINPRKRLTTQDGRPIEILETGNPLRELFA